MFRFANGYSTTSGSRGFETDDNQFASDWLQYYNDIICQSQNRIINDFSVNQNDAIGGYIKSTLLSWLWTLISPKLPAYDTARFINHKLHINFQGKTFSTENALNETYMEQRDEVDKNTARYGNTPASRHEIDILYIRKGHDAVKYYHTKYADKEIPGVGTLLTVDRYHKIGVIRGATGKITIVTTRWDEMMSVKLFGLLPVFFEDIKAVVDSDPKIYAILKALFDNDPEPVKSIMADIIKNYAEEMYKQNIDKLFLALEAQKTKTVRQLETTVGNLSASIDNYHRDLAKKYAELETAQRNLAGWVNNPFVCDENLKPFLDKSKNIRVMKVNPDNNLFQVQFITPIMNWNKNDVEMYYKHDPKTHQTYLNNPDWFAEIIRKIFIDEEYQIICTTIVNMPIINRGNAEDVFSTGTSPDGTFGNPHFVEFNCYSSSRGAYIKAIANNDYVRAISIILAATATLVFTDSSVIRRMADNLRELGNAYNKAIIKCNATGEIVSMKTLRERLAAEKEKTAEPTFHKAKAPEPAPAPDEPDEWDVPDNGPRLAF